MSLGDKLSHLLTVAGSRPLTLAEFAELAVLATDQCDLPLYRQALLRAWLAEAESARSVAAADRLLTPPSTHLFTLCPVGNCRHRCQSPGTCGHVCPSTDAPTDH